MSRFAQRWIASVLSLGLALSLVACTKKAEETAATNASVPPPTTTLAEIGVTGLDLGRAIGGDKRVAEKLEIFKPNDVIYASVATSGAASSAVLKARWTYQDGQVVDESEQTIAPTGDATTEFHISKADGWPAGKYKVEVFLNGSPIQSKEFEVKS